MNFEQLINLIHREVLRVLHRNTRETVGQVTSYDPDKHAVKVDLLPEGQTLSGWIPLRQGQAGKGYGSHLAPMIGDQVALAFHEDDREAATVIGAFFNDKQKPVSVKAGEWRYISPNGKAEFYFKDDGTFWLKGKDGTNTIIQFAPDGTITVSDGTATIKLDPAHKVSIQAVEVWLGGAVGDGSKVVTLAGPSANVYAKV
jgi:phage baseplate assembly protein gpV